MARSRFDGPLTYPSGTREQVDWSRFDLVDVDADRDKGDRGGCPDLLRSQLHHERPLIVTKIGCATFRGAADPGSLARTSVDRSWPDGRTEPKAAYRAVVSSYEQAA